MTIHSPEHDRVIGDRAGERVVGRKPLVGPPILIPAPAQDPDAGGEGGRAGGDPANHLVVRERSDEVDVAEGEAEVEQVRVGIGQAGNDGAMRQVEDGRPGAAKAQHVAPGTREDDAGALHRQRFGGGSGGVAGIDPGREHDEVRRAGSAQRAGRGGAGAERQGDDDPSVTVHRLRLRGPLDGVGKAAPSERRRLAKNGGCDPGATPRRRWG
jgi:hypothetical protein